MCACVPCAAACSLAMPRCCRADAGGGASCPVVQLSRWHSCGLVGTWVGGESCACLLRYAAHVRDGLLARLCLALLCFACLLARFALPCPVSVFLISTNYIPNYDESESVHTGCRPAKPHRAVKPLKYSTTFKNNNSNKTNRATSAPVQRNMVRELGECLWCIFGWLLL